MSKRFAMGDLHGNYKGLIQCLERANFNIEEDLLIQLGDIVDKHEDVYRTVEALTRIKNFIGIRGNHCDHFNTWLETGIHPVKWKQGGKGTAKSYLNTLKGKEHLITKSTSTNGGYITSLNPGDVPQTHKDLFRSQLSHYIDEDNNLFVHGGFNRHYPFEGQDPYIFMWDRDLWNCAMSWEQICDKEEHPFKNKTEFNHIYIGHTATTNWAEDQETNKNALIVKQRQRITKPITCANITNLDTGSGNDKGKLTMMDLDTREIFQSDLVGDLYPN